jgi:hypothetical protein
MPPTVQSRVLRSDERRENFVRVVRILCRRAMTVRLDIVCCHHRSTTLLEDRDENFLHSGFLLFPQFVRHFRLEVSGIIYDLLFV